MVDQFFSQEKSTIITKRNRTGTQSFNEISYFRHIIKRLRFFTSNRPVGCRNTTVFSPVVRNCCDFLRLHFSIVSASSVVIIWIPSFDVSTMKSSDHRSFMNGKSHGNTRGEMTVIYLKQSL